MGLKLVIKQEHNLIAYCNAMIMRWAKASVNIIKLGWIDTKKTNFADFNKEVVSKSNQRDYLATGLIYDEQCNH